MGNLDSSVIAQFILYMVALIFSLSVHESAHAWMSDHFGDDTARMLVELAKPVVHVDPIGTLLFPAISFFYRRPSDWLGQTNTSESFALAKISESQTSGCPSRASLQFHHSDCCRNHYSHSALCRTD